MNIGRQLSNNAFPTLRMMKPKLLFLLCLLALSLLYSYPAILQMRPASMHQWGQCDRASIALNYYKENLSFLQPEVNNLDGDMTGKGVSELPIIQYTVAQLWKVFGFHEWMYRLIEVLLLFGGLYCLFLTFRLFVQNVFLCIVGTLMIFTSPIVVFYGNNFLADAPSFSFVLMAWYYFFLFREREKPKPLLISIALFTMASLLKVSSMINLVAIGGIYLIERFPRMQFGEGRKIFSGAMKPIVYFISTIILVMAWYAYARQYSDGHKSLIFLTGTRTFWHCDNKLFVWQGFLKDMLPGVYHYYFLLLLCALFVLLLIKGKKIPAILHHLLIFLALGVLSIFLLFYESFRLHDYYLVTLMVLPVFILLGTFVLFERNYEKVVHSKWFAGALSVVLLFNISYAALKSGMRYFSLEDRKVYEYLAPKDELAQWRWYHWDYEQKTRAFEKMEPYNRGHGISREDRVISLGDPSFNISLCLCDQKGFTINKPYDIKDSTLCAMIKEGGAKYLFICNKDIDTIPDVQHFTKNKMGAYKNIDVYKLDSSLCNGLPKLVNQE
jgi:hypothetical protein